MASPEAAGSKVRIWDLPVRIIHWSFVVLIPSLWWTAENHEMGWHIRLGIALLALLTFRILWGFFGSSTARFAQFVRGPRAVLDYFASLKGSAAHAPAIGHNPAGGWSVLALLGLMTLQVALGLFAGDPDDGTTGPLNHLVSFSTYDLATEAHEVVFNLIVAVIALHLAAIAFYTLVKRDRLVPPMLTGKRPLPEGTPGMQPVPAWRAVACAIAALTLAWWVWSGAPRL